jgi:FKBP-type peptidyl-prolyl cis-trans isomerase
VRRLLAATALVASLSACGSGSSAALSSGPDPAASRPSGCATTAPVAASVLGTTDLSAKPAVEVPDSAPPCGLVIGDIVPGTGPAAQPGDQLTMKYVGVLHADGSQFDASWDRGEDFPFQLGAGQVIDGWDQGLVGMKAGGRRQLVIPPSLGYGEQGQGPIPPGATLVFVVDLVKIG